MKATNRQKKLLNFFKISYSPNISLGAAGWEIDAIMQKEECKERWRRYLYLTNDFDSDSPNPQPFDEAQLQSIEIPEDWSSTDAKQQFIDEVVVNEIKDASPFDNPQPSVEVIGKNFMFTGKFSFGSRKDCQTAVIDRGGYAPSRKSVSYETDYLVIGVQGSKSWKRGSYGTKIEAAILSRREHGTPSIISEKHWVAEIDKR